MSAVHAEAKASQAQNRPSRPLDPSAPGEGVAHMADRLDGWIRLQLRPQPTDADLYDVAAGVEVQPPHVAQQLLAAAHVAPAAHEVGEEGELALRQNDLTGPDPGAPPVEVQPDPSCLEVALCALDGLRRREVAARPSEQLGE